MNESILVPVHVGYARYRGLVSDKYGNYDDDYLKQLEKAVWSIDSIIFPYKDDKLPFELPDTAEVIRDYDIEPGIGIHVKKLISRLEEKEVSSVYVCGEFLWEHFKPMNEKLEKEFRETRENIQGRDQWIVDMSNTLEQAVMQLDGHRPCCVIFVYEALKEKFDVKVATNLCYPTVSLQEYYNKHIAPLEVSKTL